MKKKNPQDATLRNVRALKKRVDVLEKKVKKLEINAHDTWAIGARVKNLEMRLK